MKSLGVVLGTFTAIGAYAILAQLINAEACNSVARFYEPGTATKVFAQILFVCI